MEVAPSFSQLPEWCIRYDSDYDVEPYSHSVDWSEINERVDAYLILGLAINLCPPKATHRKDDGPAEKYVCHSNTHNIINSSGTAVDVWTCEMQSAIPGSVKEPWT